MTGGDSHEAGTDRGATSAALRSDGAVCDYRYDPASRCDGVYVDGECDQCGRVPLLDHYVPASPHAHETRRVRMELSRGHMDVSLATDASPETVAALRALGEAAIKRMEEPVPDLIGKKATIVGYSETGAPDQGFVAHVCLDIEDGLRVFFEATDPEHVWKIVEEPRA